MAVPQTHEEDRLARAAIRGILEILQALPVELRDTVLLTTLMTIITAQPDPATVVDSIVCELRQTTRDWIAEQCVPPGVTPS